MDAEIALALVEDHIVLLQVHGAAGEDAGARRDGEGRAVVAELGLVEEAATGVAADHVLEVVALQAGIQRVADLVGREEDAPEPVDTDGVGQLEVIFLDGIPDLGGRELGGDRRVKEPAHRGPAAQELFPVRGVGEAGVEKERVDGHHQPVA